MKRFDAKQSEAQNRIVINGTGGRPIRIFKKPQKGAGYVPLKDVLRRIQTFSLYQRNARTYLGKYVKTYAGGLGSRLQTTRHTLQEYVASIQRDDDPRVVTIPVKAGNLRTEHSWATPIPVRRVKVTHIKVKYIPSD